MSPVLIKQRLLSQFPPKAGPSQLLDRMSCTLQVYKANTRGLRELIAYEDEVIILPKLLRTIKRQKEGNFEIT